VAEWLRGFAARLARPHRPRWADRAQPEVLGQGV